METYILSNPNDKLLYSNGIINCNRSTCSLCKYSGYEKSDAMYWDKNNTSYVTTHCCYSLLCPKCYIADEEKQLIIAKHLFIQSLVFVQDDEDLDLEEIDDGNYNYCNNVQYNWLLYKPINKEILNQCQLVQKDYNRYGIDGVYNNQIVSDSDLDYTFIHALCICKSCNFECTAVIYMNS
jgi:hypothetical protein